MRNEKEEEEEERRVRYYYVTYRKHRVENEKVFVSP
jgi:hypothetical protein